MSAPAPGRRGSRPVRLSVYCSSSDAADAAFAAVAAQLGRRIGERGDGLVYGGTPVGLMGVVARAVREHGGHVAGVVPTLFVDRGLADTDADELVVTDDMSGRKAAMMARADAFVALPGGFGTLEEVMEVLTLKQLGYHDKPIVLLNPDGFWDRLLAFFDQLYGQRLAQPIYARLFHLAVDVDDLFDHLDRYQPSGLPDKQA